MNERLFRLPFESNDDELGPWDVLLSNDAIADMRKLEPLAIKAVMEKLMQMSSGKWNKYGLQHTVQSCIVPIYEVELPDYGGLKILWQVDYGFSIRKNSLMQHVAIWTVTVNQEQINEILENVSLLHQVYTPEHKYRCTLQQQIGKGNIILPSFGDEEATRSTQSRLRWNQTDDENLLKVHEMLATNKFVPLSKNLFRSLVRGGTDFTFQVSKLEYEIINHPSSAIVIGRSGTGKTTCIMFRLLGSYLTSQLNEMPSSNDNNANSHKRQIFITLSENLCCRVKEYFNKLQGSAKLTNEKMSMAQFYESVNRKGCSNIDVKNVTKRGKGNIVDYTPNSFRQLTKGHFPLIITYKTLIDMLLKTYDINLPNPTKKPNFDTDDNASWKHFVDYRLFAKKYWCHFNDYYRKNFDCGLVFSEFSIIKGFDSEGEYLSREDYQVISTKKFPTFCYNRDEIYDLFLEYEKKKTLNFDYDSIDLTIKILRHAKKEPLGGLQIHELYIDECQDNSIVDLALILKLFEHADNIFFAGDIAQCISRGSSFRFQDLKALVYKWELDRSKFIYNQPSAIMPKQFEMNINYRSHNGILRLASSVIDLISHFFPESIDKLPREHGEVGGPRPIVFEGFDSKAFFFHEDENESSNIEFGASQVIIVRDDKTKEHLKEKIGEEFGLILTVFESKGMEFNDVFLYNFFADSFAHSKWRVIFSAFGNHSKGIQDFYHEKHYILSSELKNLYVAVTRARQRIWIYDENTVSREPICMYWEHHGLINIIVNENENDTLSNLDEEGSGSPYQHHSKQAKIALSTLAEKKKSGPDEWNQQGNNFFERQQYDQAVFCFKKSKNKENEELAEAYLLQQVARDSIYDDDDAAVDTNFVRAAEAFIKCSMPIEAASCYQEISMHEKAGDVCVEYGMLEHAADCYFKAKKWDKAGTIYLKLEKYNKAFIAYKNGKFYKEVNTLVQRQKIDENHISTHYRSVARGLCSCGKFEEAIDNIIILKEANSEDLEVLKCILHLCRVNIIKNILTFSNTKEVVNSLFYMAKNFVKKFKSQLLEKSEQWKSLMKEIQLYSAYLNKDLNSANECIQFFRNNQEPVTEFCAVNICLQIIPQSVEHWHEWLQCLLRLCELTFLFIAPHQNADNVKKIHKYLKEIFFVKSDSHEWKVFLSNPFLNIWDKNIQHKITDDGHVYNINSLHMKMKQFLASYIFKLICDVDKKSRQIPNIYSHICHCQNSSCENHHAIPTPLILKQHLELVSLNHTIIQQIDIMYHCKGLLSKEQSEKVPGMQGWWTEKLVEIRIRYLSPQISCPEMSRMMLSKLLIHTYSGFISYVQNIWITKELKVDNFAVMLKCIFILQQLKDKQGIDMFDLEMSKIKELSQPDESLIGFEEYHGYKYYEVIPVGKRLSLLFEHLYKNYVIDAILHAGVFIQYALDNTKMVHLDNSDSLGDLVSLMEFKMSLVFMASPEYCDFCLPLAYLVNYFKAFTVKPLFFNLNQKNSYYKEDYLAAINDSFNQVKQLLEQEGDLKIILRLIRLLALISLNEFTFTQKIFDLFNHLNNKIVSPEANKYLAGNYMKTMSLFHLMKILNEDLKENGLDSLVIVHYNWGGISKFSKYESHGIVKLTYSSIDEFNSALQQISPSIAVVFDNIWHQDIFKENEGRGSIVDSIMKLNEMQCKMDGTKVKLHKRINNSPDMDIAEECVDLLEELELTHYENIKQALNSLSPTWDVKESKQEDVEWLENKLQEVDNIINQVYKWLDECKDVMN
ncbi:3516_t:CDS:10 [Entrophospora sp. SA101]|nr:3516_t:CDS:10 [Entrophospora sp. SA101]